MTRSASFFGSDADVGYLRYVSEQGSDLTDLSDEVMAHIAVEFGEHGTRATEFLSAAHSILTLGVPIPAQGELAAYSIREALKSLLETQATFVRHQTPGAASWATLSRRVAKAHAEWEDTSIASDDVRADAMKNLTVAIREMSEFHETEDLNRRRLLAVLVDRSGSVPFGDGVQLVDEYGSLIRTANTSLHGAASIEQATDYWRRVVDLLTRLFMPHPLRDQRLTELAHAADPDEQDLRQLTQLIVSPAHLETFLRSLDSAAWLPLLVDSGLLDPPETQTWWPGHTLVQVLGESHPADTLAALEQLFSRAPRKPAAVAAVAWAAYRLGAPGRPLLLACLTKNPEAVAHLAIDQARAGDPSDAFVERVAKTVLRPDVLSADRYPDPLIEALVAGAGDGNVRDRIAIVTHAIELFERRATDAASGKDPWFWLGYERGISVATGRQLHSRDFPDRLLPVLADLLGVGLSSLSYSELSSLLAPLSERLRQRLTPWTLSREGLDVDPGDLLDEIARGVTTRFPSIDDVSLVDRAVELHGQDAVDECIGRAYGEAPQGSAVDEFRGGYAWPNDWRYRLMWSPLASRPDAAWADAFAAMQEQLGEPSRDLIVRRMVREAMPFESPISPEELAALEPEELLRTVREWRPNNRSPLSSANELAGAVVDIMKDDLSVWAADPAATGRALVHPTYVSRYLWLLALELPNYQPNAASSIELIETVLSDSPPVEEIGEEADWDFDDSWESSMTAALELLKRLLARDIEIGDRLQPLVERLIEIALDPDPDYTPISPEPFDRVLSHTPAVAFNAVLAAAAWDYRNNGAARPEFASFFSRCLEVVGPTGDELRASMAAELSLLGTIVPEWIDENFSELFSDTDAGQTALDTSLKWSRPATRVLEAFPDRVLAAIDRDLEGAMDKAVVAMLWGLTGYGVGDLTRRLRTLRRLSQAGEALGHMLHRSTGLAPRTLETALEFWQAALDSRPDEPLTGFGWLAAVDDIRDDDLARLLRRTLQSMDEPIEASYQIGERLGKVVQTDDTLAVFDLMVRRRSHAFDQQMVNAAASTALRAAEHLSGTRSYERLRNALHERGIN